MLRELEKLGESSKYLKRNAEICIFPFSFASPYVLLRKLYVTFKDKDPINFPLSVVFSIISRTFELENEQPSQKWYHKTIIMKRMGKKEKLDLYSFGKAHNVLPVPTQNRIIKEFLLRICMFGMNSSFSRYFYY